MNDAVSTKKTEQGVALVLQESILFDTGKADIVKSGKPVLNKVGKLWLNLSNHIKIEGHADNRPISSYKYPSNWELSSARASSVIRYLLDKYDFNENRFTSIGYGDTKNWLRWGFGNYSEAEQMRRNGCYGN